MREESAGRGSWTGRGCGSGRGEEKGKRGKETSRDCLSLLQAKKRDCPSLPMSQGSVGDRQRLMEGLGAECNELATDVGGGRAAGRLTTARKIAIAGISRGGV